MKKSGAGKIINIGSMNSIFGGLKLVPHGAGKGGVVQPARSLTTIWAPDNIQVNTFNIANKKRVSQICLTPNALFCYISSDST